jgi:excisionase family DNA binding protein
MPIDPLHLPAVSALPHLLEVSHVAHRLSSSQEYVRRLIRDGKLAAIRLGTRWRVDPLDLQAFIERQRHAAKEDPPERSRLQLSRGA